MKMKQNSHFTNKDYHVAEILPPTRAIDNIMKDFELDKLL